MAIVIKPKRSETASSSPTVSDLAVGEIAINTADSKLYIRDSDDNIKSIGGANVIQFPYDDTDLGDLSYAYNWSLVNPSYTITSRFFGIRHLLYSNKVLGSIPISDGHGLLSREHVSLLIKLNGSSSKAQNYLLISHIALIGVAEKGYLSIEVNFNLAGGHSSMPERENAIAKAAEFVTYIQSDKIFQAQFSDPVEDFITHLGPEMSLGMKTIFALRPLTNSIILSSYQKSNTGRALTNNSAIATMISAGIKDNVVPCIPSRDTA